MDCALIGKWTYISGAYPEYFMYDYLCTEVLNCLIQECCVNVDHLHSMIRLKCMSQGLLIPFNKAWYCCYAFVYQVWSMVWPLIRCLGTCMAHAKNE